MEPRDRPSREAPPWESTSMRGLNPKILFSSREEQQDILSKFGEIREFQVHGRRCCSDICCHHQTLSGANLPPFPCWSRTGHREAQSPPWDRP